MTTMVEEVSTDTPPIHGEKRTLQQPNRSDGVRRGVRARNFISHHLTLFLAGIVQLERSPWVAWRTCMALGAMLVLPVMFLALLGHVQGLVAKFGSAGEVALYLRSGTTAEQAHQLSLKLNGIDAVAAVTHITPEQALKELEQVPRLEDALRLLERNPLPHVLIVTPKPEFVTSERIAALREQWSQLEGVVKAEADTAWIGHVQRWLVVGRYVVLGVALLLVAAIVPIIGNTVRLLVDRHRNGIEIARLVGASRGYIRRPYLYLGVWTGVLSSMMAWWLVNMLIWLVGPYVTELTGSLGIELRLTLLGWDSLWPVAIISAMSGWLAAWLAVRRQLNAIY